MSEFGIFTGRIKKQKIQVLIKTWEAMEKEFGLDIHGSIDCQSGFIQEMEEALPNNRKITVVHDIQEGTYTWGLYEITTAMISTDYIVIDGQSIELSQETLDEFKEYQEQKKLTYKKIYDKFTTYGLHFTDINGQAFCTNDTTNIPNGSSSSKQVEILQALNKLLNVAKYLNEDWVPDWGINTQKYFLCIEACTDEAVVDMTLDCMYAGPFFKSRSTAEEAIEILGHDVIRLSQTNDY